VGLINYQANAGACRAKSETSISPAAMTQPPPFFTPNFLPLLPLLFLTGVLGIISGKGLELNMLAGEF